MIIRKISLLFIGLALVVGLAADGARAEFPEKPITLILPLGAGGSHDRNARVFTSTLPDYLGNAVIVKPAVRPMSTFPTYQIPELLS